MSKSKRVGVLIDAVESEYVQKTLSGIRNYFSDKDVEIILFPVALLCSNADSYSYQYQAVASHLTSANVDGVIVFSGVQLTYASKDYVLSQIKALNPLPVVSIGCEFEGIPSILSSSEKGLGAVARDLINHGCSRFCLLTGEGNSWDSIDREKIFFSVMDEKGIPLENVLSVKANYNYDKAYSCLENIYNQQNDFDFDAVVAFNDEMAFAAIDFLHSKGLSVPQDVKVTGYDNYDHSAYTSPTLTTVEQNSSLQGQYAAEALLCLLEGKRPQMKTVVESVAVFRQTCGCLDLMDNRVYGLDETGSRIPFANDAAGIDVAEWCTKRSQISRVMTAYSGFRNIISLDHFLDSMKTEFESLGIDAAALVAFQQPVSTDRFDFFPLPDKANVLCAYDNSSGYYSLRGQNNELLFNPQEIMLPEGIFKSMNEMVVISVFLNSLLYGYVIYRPGNYDSIMYTMLIKMFSSSFSTAFLYSQAQQEKEQLKEENYAVNKISMTDDMTGLFNRRGFINYGQKTLELSQAIDQSGMVLFGDIDGLKRINDTYGHSAGDRAIKVEAKLLKNAFRSVDIVGRLGGDEFAIVAPGMTETKFLQLKEKLELTCSQWNQLGVEEFKLSFSLGWVEFTPEKGNYDIKHLLEMADESLYCQKRKKKTHIE